MKYRTDPLGKRWYYQYLHACPSCRKEWLSDNLCEKHYHTKKMDVLFTGYPKCEDLFIDTVVTYGNIRIYSEMALALEDCQEMERLSKD